MANQLVSKQNRALKLRIYPNKSQKVLIDKTLGSSRFVYNFLLNEKNEFYQNEIKPLNKPDQEEKWKEFHQSTLVELKAKFEWLREVSGQSIANTSRNLNSAYTKFYQQLKKNPGKVGLPKFKSKKQNKDSYQEYMISKTCLDREDRTIKIPKIGCVKFKQKQINPFFREEGLKYCNIAVRRNPDGRYYAVLLCEREYNYLEKSFNCESQAIGLDFSPGSLYIDSNGKSGTEFGYIPQKQANHKKLQHLQIQHARTKPNSKNREKARVKLARFERKIADKRMDFIEKESLRLVQENQLICIEDLNLKGMVKFSKNAKNYVDSSWGMFTEKLIWKASKNENNCQVVKIGRFFPSSKTCNHCGHIYKELKLSERTWTCEKCGELLNRDSNAARNILAEGISIVRSGRPEMTSQQDYISSLADLALSSC